MVRTLSAAPASSGRRRAASIMVWGVLVALPNWSCLAGDWPQWLGPDRNGVSDETVAPWTKPPDVIWRAATGSGFSCPVVADGRVFIHAAVPGQEAESIVAYDAATGSEQWRTSYDRAKYKSDLGSGPRGTPLVVDGRLYTLGITGVLSCHEAASGNRLWQVNPYDELHEPLPGFGVCTSPIVVDGRVILPLGGPGHAIVAFDSITGQLAWSVLDEPAGTASPVVISRGPEGNQQHEVVVQTSLRLVGLRPQDGTIVWEHPLVFQPSGVSPTPLYRDNLLICSTQDTGTLALELPRGVDEKPRLKWWKQDLSSYFSTGTIDDANRVFLVSNALMPLPRADVSSVDLATGEVRWRKEKLGYFHVGLIETANGALLLLDDAGTLLLCEPRDTELAELARAKVCRGTFVVPALANGRLYVRDDQELICLGLPPVADRSAVSGQEGKTR